MKHRHLPNAVWLCLIGLLLCGSIEPAGAETDLVTARAALSAADRGDWGQAESLAAQSSERLILKLVQWMDFQRPQAGHSFDEVSHFIDANPDWPMLATLRLRAEDGIADVPDSTLIAWFAQHKPVTGAGKLRQAQIMMNQGHSAEAIALVRTIWVESDFSPADETRLLDQFGSSLTTEDHIHRLDRLLWDGKTGPANDMLSRVPSDWRLLAEARIKLQGLAKTADAAVAKVPRSVADNPGLAFDRMKFRRRKNQEDAAATILEQQVDLGRPEAWWPERQILARRLLQLGQASRAYRLVANNQLHDPSALTDAEFTAGWIALRFLKDPAKAAPHFARLYEAAKYPLTLSRAAYWAGRAADALGKPEEGNRWYEKAARFTTTYYGQLAGGMPGVIPPEKPEPEPKATPQESAAFEQKELVRVVRLLIALGMEDRMKPFLNRLAELAQTPAEFAAVADFAEAIGRPDLGVAVAKKAYYSNVSLLRAGYPVVWVPRNAGTEQALLLALTRQESAFDVGAISPSGARGLMQLMPGTGKDVARSIGVPFTLDSLTRDGTYNVTLGQAYFDSLLANFNGSYVLAIASYNAGPGRIQQWIGEFGDPRQPDTDPVDWVESIPYSETRNYVQRVLENLQVYRLRIGDHALAFSLAADLRR
jgi:soluble lytic murein transglycosylase